MPDQQTRDAYHAALNELVAATFGVGRWEYGTDYSGWTESECAARAAANRCGCKLQERFVPLAFSTSLDAVRQVEEAVLITYESLMAWRECLLAELGLDWTREPGLCAIQMARSSSLVRTLALLRWRGVSVPERPEEE